MRRARRASLGHVHDVLGERLDKLIKEGDIIGRRSINFNRKEGAIIGRKKEKEDCIGVIAD